MTDTAATVRQIIADSLGRGLFEVNITHRLTDDLGADSLDRVVIAAVKAAKGETR